MSKDREEEAYEAFCARMFALPDDPYHGPVAATTSTQMTDAEWEAWAQRAHRFLNGCPNRAARVRPKYKVSFTEQPGMTMFAQFM